MYKSVFNQTDDAGLVRAITMEMSANGHKRTYREKLFFRK